MLHPIKGAFNRTILELKHHLAWQEKEKAKTFNRTILELKLDPMDLIEILRFPF